MSTSPYTQAQVLLIKASEDEAALQATGNPDAVLGFHAQQSVEKLMKALISARSAPFELTHNLLRLNAIVLELGEALPATPVSLSDLNDFAVEYRYDLLFQNEAPNVVELIETVRLIREYVVARIAALSGAHNPPFFPYQ
ncbi:MAG: HEPN domain-containing protein [Terracidiphilus sp.]